MSFYADSDMTILLSVVFAQYKKLVKVLNKSMISMLSSEAAAATAVIMDRCCAFRPQKEQPIEFKADRPFLFFIRESRQNIVLFSGKFASPPTPS
ncbi:unnamed protein product [Rotaria sp. Silwood1]|nr:unnamed protein product [Rotaria sp. Silwood1]